MRRGLLSAVLASICAVASPLSTAAETVAELALSGAWVRAMPPGQKMTAAYLEIRNDSPEPVTINGATAASGHASLHETRTVEGRSSMRPVDALTLAPGERVQLQPGGLHIMLMGLEHTPQAGEAVPVCVLTQTSTHCIDAPVRRGPPVHDEATGHHH